MASTGPRSDADCQLTIDGLEELIDRGSDRRPSRRGDAHRGPKGARVGDVVVAEGSRWTVDGLDLARHEAICQLIGGSGALRRFRARHILKVERAKGMP
jgi:hypothetical protein